MGALMMLQGIIVRAQSGFYDVQTETGHLICRLRGRLKRGSIRGDIAAVGDRVVVLPGVSGTGSIESVLPRQRALVRLAPDPKGTYQQILLANLDQVVLVFSFARPAPHLRMLDRFLVIVEKQKIPAMIVVNKLDLVENSQNTRVFSHYPSLGYPLLFTSAITGQGVPELHRCLREKLSALAGPSGVGKSSLLNLIQPGLGLSVHEVSQVTGKGRHTTHVRQLFALDGGGYVADMPGIKSLALWDTYPEELDGYFPEMRNLVDRCQFSDCSHRHEPGCAVRQAIEEGTVNPERYQSYLRLRYGEE
jgi:ribosome biogenesis GTPase